jgi:hypothetical protein
MHWSFWILTVKSLDPQLYENINPTYEFHKPYSKKEIQTYSVYKNRGRKAALFIVVWDKWWYLTARYFQLWIWFTFKPKEKKTLFACLQISNDMLLVKTVSNYTSWTWIWVKYTGGPSTCKEVSLRSINSQNAFLGPWTCWVIHYRSIAVQICLYRWQWLGPRSIF